MTAVPSEQTNYNMPFILVISMVSALGGFLFGYDLLVISGAKEFYQLYFDLVSPASQGWAVSSCIVGCIAGALFVGKPADRYGRTILLALSGLLFFVSALGSALATDFNWFVVYRLLGGVGMGMASTLSPMYIAEVAPARLRGRFVSLNQLTIVLGILAAQLVNYLIMQYDPVPAGATPQMMLEGWVGQTGWRLMFAAEALPAGIFMVLMFFVPKSPRFLVKIGKEKEARQVLTRIGGDSYGTSELSLIQGSLSKDDQQVPWRSLMSRPLLGVVLMGVAIAVYQQWCGINVIFNYASDIFKDAGYEVSGILFNLVIIGLTNLAFTLVGMRIIDSVGRKPLMIWGSLGLGLCHFLIGYCYYTGLTGIYVFVLALAAVACFAATLGPVAWVLISELFPNRIRGMAMSLAVLSLWVANFVLSFTFPILKDALGPSFTFWVYGVVCLVGLFYSMGIPETKGKSLEEIELAVMGGGSQDMKDGVALQKS